MYNFYVFAGTAEGRTLAHEIGCNGIRGKIFTATEYGASLIEEDQALDISFRRLDEDEMEKEMENLEENGIVLDATHPYAVEVSRNIQEACKKTGRSYIRVLRETSDVHDLSSDEQVLYAENVTEAAQHIARCTQGNVLLTTGSKELAVFTSVPDYKERLYARVLSLPSVAAQCAALGFEGRHLICMQGPFSKELNAAMIRQLDIRWVVTKESGKTGGFQEKCQAAVECGCGLIIIGRPVQEEGISLADAIRLIREKSGKTENGMNSVPQVTLVGIGMGTADTLTEEGKRAVREADLLIGASRMLEHMTAPGQKTFVSYRPSEIRSCILNHPECRKVAVLLSGDVGFYSGAARLLDCLKDLNPEVICGISSMIYFCARLHTDWQDIVPVSVHGRECNIVGTVQQHPRVFAIAGSTDAAAQICRKLVRYGMGDVFVHVGQRLSYADEKIIEGRAHELTELETDALSVVLLENPSAARRIVAPGIPDQEFIRAQVPMTKEEVRTVSISKLRLTEHSVVYDIGAGTGSVSVEMARLVVGGKVYAIERKTEAADLIEQNRIKFGCDNLTVIRGLAPDALEDLEAPTHVFIGGSAGNLKAILKLVLKKNPEVRVVLNAITLETSSEMLECLKELPFEDAEIVTLNTARAKKAGPYHLMMAQNPVTVISASGKADCGQQEEKL